MRVKSMLCRVLSGSTTVHDYRLDIGIGIGIGISTPTYNDGYYDVDGDVAMWRCGDDG